ncbi:MAG: hypothetical protein MK161_08270 [Pirellulales bacterium]|nr:hypothetical protein [Pirellulales bacterium]
MKNRTLFVGMVSAALLGAMQSEGYSQKLAGHDHFSGTFGFGGLGGTSITTVFDLYRIGLIPVPPYFALHPPVYYSYPVPRPYGYSPFAYSGNVRTPEIMGEVMGPVTIRNPFVPNSPSTEADHQGQLTSFRQASPLIVLNPYVEQAPKLAKLAP